jgi:hypothetical protein
MIIGPNDPMPPLSAFPPETQKIVMQILLKAAKNRQERLAGEAAESNAKEV